MRELVELIAKALVDHPDEVVVTQTQEGKNIRIQLHVAPSDMGKVIGKQGRIIAYHAAAAGKRCRRFVNEERYGI